MDDTHDKFTQRFWYHWTYDQFTLLSTAIRDAEGDSSMTATNQLILYGGPEPNLERPNVIISLLAATMTLQTVLKGMEDFSSRAGLDLPHPITTNMVTKYGPSPEYDEAHIIVRRDYHFFWAKGAVEDYTDGASAFSAFHLDPIRPS